MRKHSTRTRLYLVQVVGRGGKSFGKGLVINYGEGGGEGGYKMGKSRVRNFLRPLPQDRVKMSAPPL